MHTWFLKNNSLISLFLYLYHLSFFSIILLFLSSYIYLVAELLGLKTGYFSLRQIKAATNNFDPANKIGEGGFGPVFKVNLIDYNHVKQYEVLKHWG